MITTPEMQCIHIIRAKFNKTNNYNSQPSYAKKHEIRHTRTQETSRFGAFVF